MVRRMGKTPNKRETSFSGTETMSPHGSPEWISGAEVHFKTPKSAVKQTRSTRRSSFYQGKKSPQKQDNDSKQTPNGRFKVPVPFVISPPGVKTRARRSSIYQKTGGKYLVTFSPPKEVGTQARATRRTSMIVPGKATKKNSSPVTHSCRSFRTSMYVKQETENTTLKSVIEKVDISSSEVVSSNTPSEAVVMKPASEKKSPYSGTKKKRIRSVSKSPSPDKSPAAKRAKSDQETSSPTPARRQSGKISKASSSSRDVSKTPRRKWNITENTHPIEVIVLEMNTPDLGVAETARGRKSANKVTKTPGGRRKSTTPKKEQNSPLRAPTNMNSPVPDTKSPSSVMDKNFSAIKRKKSPVTYVKCPSPKKFKTPVKYHANQKSPLSNKVKTPPSQKIILKTKPTPAEKVSILQSPTSKSPESGRKYSYSSQLNTLAVVSKDSSFTKRKKSASPLLCP